jgi:hypothetical protein
MPRKAVLAVAALVLVGAGAAVAATQATGPAITSVCVNDTNGLIRASDVCRDGEHAASVGGGGSSTRVTQNGTFTVPWGETGGAKALPLTGVTISGRCETFTNPFGGGDGANARALIEAPSGKTMDYFPNFGNPPTTSSVLQPPAASFVPGMGSNTSAQHAILTSNGATATIETGGYVNSDARTCVFLWQAVEAPN